MLAQLGTEEGPPAFCIIKQPCTDGMLALRLAIMTLQEG